MLNGVLVVETVNNSLSEIKNFARLNILIKKGISAVISTRRAKEQEIC